MYISQNPAPPSDELHGLALQMTRWMNTLMVILMVYLSYAGVQTALKQADGLNPLVLWSLLGEVMVLPLYFICRMMKLR